MQKKATYSGPYSLVFAAVTVIVCVVAVVRQDGTITLAATMLGLYILHLLSLRALNRGPAVADRRRSDPETPHTTPRAAVRGSSEQSRAAIDTVIRASSAPKPEKDDGPVFFSPQSGFVEEIEEPSTPHRQKPATEDSGWMVRISAAEEEPEFLTVDDEVIEPQPIGQKEVSSDVPIPRKFALGTVAIIRRALNPAQVARVLEEQRKFPKKRFGEIAVELDYISEAQLEELLAAQRAGLFTEEEIQGARTRLESFRRSASAAL